MAVHLVPCSSQPKQSLLHTFEGIALHQPVWQFHNVACCTVLQPVTPLLPLALPMKRAAGTFGLMAGSQNLPTAFIALSVMALHCQQGTGHHAAQVLALPPQGPQTHSTGSEPQNVIMLTRPAHLDGWAACMQRRSVHVCAVDMHVPEQQRVTPLGHHSHRPLGSTLACISVDHCREKPQKHT